MLFPKKFSKCTLKSDELESDKFGWWIGDSKIENIFIPKYENKTDSRSSSESIHSDNDFNKPNNDEPYHDSYDELAINLNDHRENNVESYSSRSYTNDNLNLIDEPSNELINSIENDDYECDAKNDERAYCYTPERIIKSQDYRILIPSPRFSTLIESLAITNILWSQNSLRNASTLFQLNNTGTSNFTSSNNPTMTHMYTRLPKNLNPLACLIPQRFIKEEIICDTETLNEDQLSEDYIEEDKNQLSTDLLLSQNNQYDSNISSETVKSCENINDELPYFLRNPSLEYLPQKTNEADDEIIIENLLKEHNYLLREDRFNKTQSKHNLLTRLALSIETDGESTYDVDNENNVIQQLQIKIEQLQRANTNIYEEISTLKDGFRNDIWNVGYLSTVAKQLYADLHETKFLDDLLDLLQGKLERVSRREWPFAIRHSEYGTKDLNLVV